MVGAHKDTKSRLLVNVEMMYDDLLMKRRSTYNPENQRMIGWGKSNTQL